MSDNIEIDNSNEWINWIEEAISKKHIKYYDYQHFHNIQKIGNGSFGKIYRANWKSSEQYLVLKSFYNLNNDTLKEIIHELELQREVDFHDNIIRFYGITSTDKKNQMGQLKKYLLVMEYANGNTLRNYLVENFKNLTWEDKCKFAYQLACAVSCLHDEGIVHRDLHSNNILIHQKTIKLADFGLSKRIDESSNIQSKIFGVVPYVDPKRLNKEQDKDALQKLKFCDVYSIGVLFWELSSGHRPFENRDYDLHLAMDIAQGLRETPVPDTPNDYIKLYTECWDGEPDNRPTINLVVTRLKAIITEKVDYKLYPQLSDEQQLSSDNVDSSLNTNSSLHGELTQIMQNFDKVNIKENGELDQIIQSSDKIKKLDLSITINQLIDLLYKELNEGREDVIISQHIFDYFNNQNITSLEIYNWLLNNQNNSNLIHLCGYFNYHGIGTNVDEQMAFELFQKAANLENSIAQYNLANMFAFGISVDKDYNKVFELFKKSAEGGFSGGINSLGYCYQYGIGTSIDNEKAFELYQKAANLGNCVAQYNLADMYRNEEEDYSKAFELFKKSAEKEHSFGITMLGYCYKYGIGTSVDNKKALELYQKAANLGNSIAQYNLANMYINGKGVDKDKDQAIYWYKKSAEQGDEDAENELEKLEQEH